MTEQLDDDDEGTVVVDRSEPDEHTVVVDRSAPAPPDEVDDGTVVVDRSEPDESTVVVDRSEPDESTVVVDRSEPDESTVVVDRSEPGESDESTVVVDRSAPDDKTVVVEGRKADGQKPGAAKKASGPVMRTLPRRGAKREVTLAPGVAGTNKKSRAASGPGAVAAYEARSIPAPPPPAPIVELGPESSRAHAPSMPSVARQSRRRGRIALVAFAVAIIVSVTGLVVIVSVLLGG